MATTIDGVKTLQIRNAKNGDFDLNFGGSGGESKPLFPTVKVEVGDGDSVVFTIVEQGQLISNVNVEIHVDGNIESFLCGTICLNVSDVMRYFLCIDRFTVLELSIDESNQEILNISQVFAQISVVISDPLSCEPCKAYGTAYNIELKIDGTTQMADFVRLPLSIAEVSGESGVYIVDGFPKTTNFCLLVWIQPDNKSFTRYEKIGVIETVYGSAY